MPGEWQHLQQHNGDALAAAVLARGQREDARIAAWQRGIGRAKLYWWIPAGLILATVIEVAVAGSSIVGTITIAAAAAATVILLGYVRWLRRRYGQREPMIDPWDFTAR